MNKDRTQSARRIFNTPFDIGLRSLFILRESKGSFDLQSLVYLDYFLVHSGDIQGGPKSLHPDAQFRAGEILIKRKLMKDGLKIMHLKQLVDVKPEKEGIYYMRNKLTNPFLNHCSSAYARELQKRAKWVHKKFGRYNEVQLKRYVSTNLQKWGVEFVNNVSIAKTEKL